MNTNLDKELYGVDLFGDSMKPTTLSPVAQRFLVVPFSVLNAREGDWQARKDNWISLGLSSEKGRAENLLGMSIQSRVAMMSQLSYEDSQKYVKSRRDQGLSDALILEAVKVEFGEAVDKGGTSIFDPVLCELCYRWWSPEGGQILDPFSGGSVRGIVASFLERHYWGCDLRPEQVESNREQGATICKGKFPPKWVCGDSMHEVASAPEADFVFSCPPYGDLEQYSDSPEDLSTMSWVDFRLAYREIIKRSCARLRNNRFACFVVGDYRDEKGNYRNFVSETISAFLDSGLSLYNEAILVTAIGSAAMRVTRMFSAGKKLCKTHQNVLVFVKGDGRKASDNIKETT